MTTRVRRGGYLLREPDVHVDATADAHLRGDAEDSFTSSAYPADPSVMPTPSAADADVETTASPKQKPKSAPSPRPTPEVSPRSEARDPRPRPTPVSTPTSDSGGVAEDVSASTDIEDDLHEPVAADEDTGPRPASNADASTSGVAGMFDAAVAAAAEDAAPRQSPSRMSRTPSRTSSTRTNLSTPPVPRLRPRRL